MYWLFQIKQNFEETELLTLIMLPSHKRYRTIRCHTQRLIIIIITIMIIHLIFIAPFWVPKDSGRNKTKNKRINKEKKNNNNKKYI